MIFNITLKRLENSKMMLNSIIKHISKAFDTISTLRNNSVRIVKQKHSEKKYLDNFTQSIGTTVLKIPISSTFE